MEHLDSHPLNLADVAHDVDYPIDPSLDDDQHDLFLPEVSEEESNKTREALNALNQHQRALDHAQHIHQTHQAHVDSSHIGGGSSSLHGSENDVHDANPLDDAAVSAIKASLSQAQAQAKASRVHPRAEGSGGNGEKTGQEDNPTVDPPIHTAPYSKPDRDDATTPNPEHILFTTRYLFNVWLEGESSWCHFVQRRTTTPEKRAEERMKARIKAHEKMIMSMSPDEAANAPPLKRRKRLRTSPVIEKITYTCHHAGKYSSKHSSDLPQNKLRLNTKPSVKCNCPARVVLTEVDGGACKVQYYWKHDGHDPYATGEYDSGRLPKVVDDWLVAQISNGKDTDEIRKMLSLTEEEKTEYVRKALEDPSIVTPDMVPPLAFQMKIKYPDIYNRFRKLKGPIRLIKIPKSRQKIQPTSDDQNGSATPSEQASGLDLGQSGSNHNHHGMDTMTSQHLTGLEGLGDMGVLPSSGAGIEHQFGENTVDGLDLSGHEMLAQFADQSGHSELAQALMRLPSGPNGDGDDASRLEEEVMKMARMAAESAAAAEQDKEDDEWAGLDGM